MRLYRSLVLVALLVCWQGMAHAQNSATPPSRAPTNTDENTAAPYDDKLLRLSEVLGSIHYLRNLCGANEGNKWRDFMAKMLETEQPTEKRKARLVARFNRGYRAFDQSYQSCTQSALLAAEGYMKEGVLLSSQITARYGR